jgi:hypothetical protein
MNNVKACNSCKSLKLGEILAVSKFVPESTLKTQEIRVERSRTAAINSCK